MKEEIISFEQARLLKECGFDWPCDHYYTKENAADDEVWLTSEDVANWNANDVYPFFLKPLCSAPTLALAQKWLRDKKGVFVGVTCDMTPTNSNPFGYEVKIPMCSDRNGVGYESYEAALSAGLDTAIELIKQK